MTGNPRHIAALHRAVGLENDGAFFEAEQIFKQLIRQSVRIDHAHYQYAQFLLRKGEYEKAWPLFMQRVADTAYRERSAASLSQPYWDGKFSDSDAERSILIYADQGIGDALMCARFLPVLAKKFKRVTFVTFQGFRELFSSIGADVDIIEFGDDLPPFDVHANLFSIPALLNISIADIPDQKYLTVEAQLKDKWAQRMASDKLNVGLVWQGNPSHSRDQERSAQLSAFEPILECDAAFFCLQVGDQLSQIDHLSDPSKLTVFPEITESVHARAGKMLETAGLVSTLDLVICVDTSVTHLAGALGIPAWVLVSKVSDWRWMTDGDVSPWYPRSRIFRATTRYDWNEPIQAITHQLQELISSRTAR